jgi:hypothetical protein
VKKLRLLVLTGLLLGCVAAWLWLAWLDRSGREEPYSLVEDGLYVGRAVPEPPPGTRAVVNLCDAEDRYSVEATLWEPILDDNNAPDLDWLRRVVEFVADRRRAGPRRSSTAPPAPAAAVWSSPPI